MGQCFEQEVLMKKYFYKTPVNCMAERVSWTELDHICCSLNVAKNSLRYYGNHLDDDFDRVYALFSDAGDAPKRFYCVLLFSRVETYM